MKLWIHVFLFWVLTLGTLVGFYSLYPVELELESEPADVIIEELLSEETTLGLLRDLFFTRHVPGKGSQVFVKRGCETIDDLFRIKPFIDGFNLEASRDKYATMILSRGAECFDADFIAPNAMVLVELERLVAQTYLGNARIMQYWVATFTDGKTLLTWFEFRGVEV